MFERTSTWVILGLFALVVFVAPASATLITDLWWFQSLGHDRVFWLITGATWGLGLAAGAFAWFAVWANVSTALRNTPRRPARLSSDLTDNPLGSVLSSAPPGVLGTLLGLLVALLVGGAAATWRDAAILAWYGGDFGFVDPVFGLDASFYTFVLPLVLDVRATLMALLVICTFASAGVYIARSGIKVELVEVDGEFQANGLTMAPEVRRHLGTLVAGWLLLMALGVVLHRFELLYDQRGLFAGPGYTELTATLPLLNLQTVMITLAAAAAFRAFERLSGGWAVLAIALTALPWALVGAWPATIQRFSVEPNELSREAPHIANHIEATRYAFSLDAVTERALSGENALTLEVLEKNHATINNVRLWDHEQLLDTFAQVQEIRTYYEFTDVDNDRYRIDGELRQVMLSPRELLPEALPAEARTWVNQKMTYTHGYGMALGPVNEVTDQGLPKLFIQDLPPAILKPELRIDRPELYFGEAMSAEVFVNTANPEFDHPRGDENVYTTYAGKGGVVLGGMRRLWFAMRFGSSELLFSNDITAESRVLLHRRVRTRIQQIAPFLHVDDDPYLVIADGRLVWIVDAYTSTNRFPYSELLPEFAEYGNYLRNSVKVTVDAYDGDVLFYRTNVADPIADAWSAALPDLFHPLSDMPATLRAHIRYPDTLFDLQARLYAKYHMDDIQVFYNQEDLWEIPQVDSERMKPYYTVMTLPGESSEEFVLMLPFNPQGKPNLAAWLTARSDGDAYGELRVYTFPKEKMVYGPGMVVARINQTDTISEKISLWNQQGSSAELGTLLVIPVEESLLYVQPLYLSSSSEGDAIPELKRVIVAYNDDIAMAANLEDGLAQLFGAPAEARVPRLDDGTASGAPIALDSTEAQLITRAKAEWVRAREAAAAGDWSSWGAAIEALGLAVEQLEASVAQPEPVPEPAAEPSPPEPTPPVP